MPKIFISYRRADSRTHAGRIYDKMTETFGKGDIFKDIDNIPFGRDFRGVLSEAVNACDVMLVIIGQHWLNITDEEGNRRLDNPTDFVRIEIQSGLQRGDARCLVIPVIIDSSMMPSANKLPLELRELAFKNAITVHDDPDFHRDMERLIRQLKQYDKELNTRRAVEEAERQRIEGEQARQQSQAEEAARVQPKVEETERQRKAELEVKAKAEAGERERQRKEQDRIEQQRIADEESRLLAEAEAAERKRKADVEARTKAEADERERQRLAQLAAKTKYEAEQRRKRQIKYFANLRSFSMILGFIVVLIVGIFILLSTIRLDNNLSPKTPQPTKTANQNSILHNSEWKPVEKDFNGVTMVEVPSGCFDMGNDPNAYDGTTKGVANGGHICFSQVFWIDKTEVTNAQFAQFGGKASNSSKWTDANRPRESISWFESRDFCELRGGRLPTEAEWEYAVRGPDNLVYSWGSEFDASNVVFAENSNNQTALVGSKPLGVSWVGALDMIGNVLEWLLTLYKPYPYPTPAGMVEQNQWVEKTNTSDFRGLRGGSWSRASDFLSAAGRSSQFPNYTVISIGFRCVMSAPVS